MEWVKLGEITIIHDGKRIPLNNAQRLEKSTNPIYPYYGANGLVDYIDDYIFDEELPILCIAEDGGSWGLNEKCSYIIREKCWVNNHAHVITVIDDYNLNYINYYLNYSDLNKYITGTTRGKLTQKELKNIVIPNFSLEIQNKIVNKLKTIETLIQTRQDQIQAFDDLVESVFDQMFGDVQENNKSLISKKLGDVVKVNQVLQIAKSKRFDKKVENSYKYITIRYLNGNSDTEYIQNPQASVICNKDDILVARTGNTGQIITGVDGVFHNNFFKVNYDKNQFNKTYLYKYLTNKKIQDKMLMLAGTSTIPDLNHKNFYSIDVLIPPIEKQNHFAAFVEKIEKQKQILNDSLGQLTMLFDSLMQDAFDGSLMK